MPHKCHGNANNCPSRSHPIWELPINELDRRDDPTFDETLSGCHLVSSCSNIYERAQFRRLLDHNFNRHYSTNRAPLSLSFDTAWLKVNKGFTKELAKWIRSLLLDHSDVYFVTNLQVRFFGGELMCNLIGQGCVIFNISGACFWRSKRAKGSVFIRGVFRDHYYCFKVTFAI